MRKHARRHPWIFMGLGASLLVIVVLTGLSIAQVLTAPAGAVVRYALLGGMAGLAATAIGSMPALVLRHVPQKVEDGMLGMAAGMMLAASAFSLLLPGIEAGGKITGSKAIGAGLVVIGMAIGVLLMLGMDEFMPHEHENTGVFGAGHERTSRLWLFVFAIALHNLPEGMAIGVGFSQGDMSVGVPLTVAIALQDLPEGLAVAIALRSAGFTAWRAVFAGTATGILEPIGALLGVGLSTGFAAAYPIGLGLAGGAMLFVVSHEVIPETHRNGHQTPATIGLMGGFALMMVLDVVLG
ncbi:MAG: ZIP family metal transporter [Oxalobacter sp.]|nr:MAG: ZIP family metal transporter [Oxalobacter sp.]